MKIKILLFALVSISFFSCEKMNDPLEDDDFLIFGTFYGECIGDQCVRTYKLTDTELYVDTKKQYAGQDYDFELMSDEDFQIAKELDSKFPSKLWDETEQTIGCPDCYDQGGVLIDIEDNDEKGYWLVDQTTDDIPNYLVPFIEEVNEVVQKLNE